MFKADWQRNSDAATWSIWLLIRAPTLRNPNDNPLHPCPPLPTAPRYATVRLQPGPHLNPSFTFKVIILSSCAYRARHAVQCKHADLYFCPDPLLNNLMMPCGCASSVIATMGTRCLV